MKWTCTNDRTIRALHPRCRTSMGSKTTNDERPGNDAMGVQAERADAEGVMADGAGFGNQAT